MDSLIEHIERRTLFTRAEELLQRPASTCSAADRELLVDLLAARDHILEDILRAADQVSHTLQDLGIGHRIDRASLIANPPQFQQLDLHVARRDLRPAIEALRALGYRCPVTRRGAGWMAFTLTDCDLLLTHVDAATTRVRMCWQSPWKGMSRLAMREDDIARFDWPEWTWPLALAAAFGQRIRAGC